MTDIAKKHRDRLSELKCNVEDSNRFFKKNYERYTEFMSFVFYEALTQQDRQTLEELGKPTLEFNILEAYISRLRGEFAKQQPSLIVRAADGIPAYMINNAFSDVIKTVEAHLRAIFFDASNDKLEYDIYSDLLGGGFSVFEVYTDYINNMSFDQNIFVGRPFSPLLCGFDPMAQESHKGDGKYCFQLYPKTRKDFEARYGKKATEGMALSKSIEGFSWSYMGDSDDIVLICDYYEKQMRPMTIHKLTNGLTVTDDQYKELLERWEESGLLEQPPAIEKSRKSWKEQIIRYRFCENQMLDVAPTNYEHLPLVFVDGNSVKLSSGHSYQQVTRPYVYHAKGAQRLKNYSGQSLGGELENIVQHKWVVAQEALPDNVTYLDAYQNVQKADTLIYKHYNDGDPSQVLPPPREVQRAQIPPDIMATFQMCDSTTQSILGSYDAALGINDNQLSGIAINNGAIQSNNASVPYLIGYIKGLNRVAQIITDLIPKYYRTPRTIPVLTPSGKRDYVVINEPRNPDSIDMKYDAKSLQVKVETGVNFALQKEASLRTITQLMQASPTFSDFINTKGLNFILDNIEVRGIEELKEKAQEFERELEQKQQQQSQMQQEVMQQQMQVQQAKAQAEVQKDQADAMKAMKEAQGLSKSELEQAKLDLEAQKAAADATAKQEKLDLDTAELLAKIQREDVDNMLEQQRIEAENLRSNVELMKDFAMLQKQAIENEEE